MLFRELTLFFFLLKIILNNEKVYLLGYNAVQSVESPTGISAKQFVSIFRVEEKAKQETRVKAGGTQSFQCYTYSVGKM
jgi:hypothetical protein